MKNHILRLVGGTWRPIAAAVLVLAAGAWGGCARPDVHVEIPSGVDAEWTEQGFAEVDDELMHCLQRSLDAARELKTFRTNFLRQERLGAFVRELHPVEDILAEYRDEPFSVRFSWRGDGSEYRQCVYVDGANGNMVLLLPRKGLFGLPASVQKYPAQFAVEFHKARNPITDFGPRRMMERIIDRIEKAKAHGPVLVREGPTTEVGPAREPCRHFVLRYPKGDEFACKLQDLYLHKDTNLPVATYLWLTDGQERSPATLDGMYVYAGLEPNVSLTDGNFEITEAEAKKGSDGKSPSRRASK